MLRHWDRLRDGVLGQFTPVAEDGSSRGWRPGHLCVTPEGQVQLKILLSEEDGHPMTVHPDEGHNVFVGLTEAGTVLVTRIRRWTTSPGYGTGCPVRRYEADVVLDEVDLELVEGDGFFGAQLHYYGLQDWTPGKTIVEPFDKIDSDLRWRLDVISLPEAATHLGERLQLSLSEAFVLGGQPDERRIGAPLRVKVEAAERRSLVDLLVVLDAVHALLVLAHPGEVRARAGFAKLGPEARWAGLWDADMMRQSTSEQPPAAGWTVVKLENLGGSEGVAA